jgi:hypothetical protein
MKQYNTKTHQEYNREYNRDTTMNSNQSVPVCTSLYQYILVHTGLYWVLLAARPTPVFTLTRPARDAVKLGIPYTHRPGTEQPGPPGRAITEEACSCMRQPPPRGRRRPSTAAQAAGGPSYREIQHGVFPRLDFFFKRSITFGPDYR